MQGELLPYQNNLLTINKLNNKYTLDALVQHLPPKALSAKQANKNHRTMATLVGLLLEFLSRIMNSLNETIREGAELYEKTVAN
ncbi:hypothetical protein A9Q81_10720 [Gammaproteobacteria bacterium 42_54_T18]|nr:hypothetical protein A9Q81_10720 [Gammaproteobacteria bacterium 42_54_T18]